MASLEAICVVRPLPPDLAQRLAPLGVAVEIRALTGHLWIEGDERLAIELSRALGGTALHFIGQRTAGCYGITEFASGHQISAMTIDDGGFECTGEPRSWHRELQYDDFELIADVYYEDVTAVGRRR